MTLTEIRSILSTENLRLTRSLGQNFLHDANQVIRMLDLAEIRPGEHVLEIGPGLGPLTERILAAGGSVLAIEKDARLVDLLRRRLGNQTALEVVNADALDWLKSNPRDWSAWKFVSNLPYSVGSPILVEISQSERPPGSLVVTLQAEVVDRIRASAGTPEYGLLTVLLAERYRPGTSFRIPATCFFPPPDVVSACLRLDRAPSPLVDPRRATAFRRWVKLAFSQRRKQLRSVLRSHVDAAQLDEVWRRMEFDDRVRAETLPPKTLARWVEVLESVLGNSLPDAPGK